MAPVPRAGRNKIALLQDRLKHRSPSLHLNYDWPENIADCLGSLDYWLKSIKAFRWHDAQLDLDPNHTVTRHAIVVMLGIDRTQVVRFLRKYGVASARPSEDAYRWQTLRWPVCQELTRVGMNELLQLSFEASPRAT